MAPDFADVRSSAAREGVLPSEWEVLRRESCLGTRFSDSTSWRVDMGIMDPHNKNQLLVGGSFIRSAGVGETPNSFSSFIRSNRAGSATLGCRLTWSDLLGPTDLVRLTCPFWAYL